MEREIDRGKRERERERERRRGGREGEGSIPQLHRTSRPPPPCLCLAGGTCVKYRGERIGLAAVRENRRYHQTLLHPCSAKVRGYKPIETPLKCAVRSSGARSIRTMKQGVWFAANTALLQRFRSIREIEILHRDAAVILPSSKSSTQTVEQTPSSSCSST